MNAPANILPAGYTQITEARFRQLGKAVLGIEGGHADHQADRGGETQYGISLRFLKSEGKIDLNGDGFADFDLDFDGDIDGADIRRLTPDLALDLFRRCIWIRGRCWDLPRPFDGMVFDQAVNGGAIAAGKILQRALNRACAIKPWLAVDGDIGPATRRRLDDCLIGTGYDRLIRAFQQEAVARYRAIVEADASQVVFLKGWIARAERLGDV